ncbi:MAG: ketosteroid isomerase family protein [Actinomycetota bacterium]
MLLKRETFLTDTLPLVESAETAIERYFDTMNTHDFQATADLFAVDGVLNAPFEEPIVGRSAIATYLNAEAQGMQLYPREISQTQADNARYIQIRGQVKTSVFVVNVAWVFLLNSQQEIVSVTVKLLASPAELLNLRPATKFEQSQKGGVN